MFFLTAARWFSKPRIEALVGVFVAVDFFPFVDFLLFVAVFFFAVDCLEDALRTEEEVEVRRFAPLFVCPQTVMVKERKTRKVSILFIERESVVGFF